jgi:hypothetical protein
MGSLSRPLHGIVHLRDQVAAFSELPVIWGAGASGLILACPHDANAREDQ